MLDGAELLARHGKAKEAVGLLDHTSYGEALSAEALSLDREANAIDTHFRYWRLRYLLASSQDDVPESVPPSTDTPAGNDLSRDAPVHSNADAIELGARVDSAVRTLGKLDAANASGQTLPEDDMLAALVPLLDIFAPSMKRRSGTLGAIVGQKSELMRIIGTVVLSYGNGLPQRLSDALARRFEEKPEQWSLSLRLDIAELLTAPGARPPWYQEALVRQEASAASQDLYSRLEDRADLVCRYARNGEQNTARRLVRTLGPMAFGVGHRKDYQFDSWVAWLGRALAEPGGDRFVEEATWLARLLTALESITKGTPGSAAADLPAAVVPADPIAAVRIFEYLVRQGTVRHLDALAALVRALVALRRAR